MPKISILIPIFNVDRYLGECLDSVINQTLRDIEIICVNDGSTDRSLSIIEEYASKDKRIKLIDKPNTGYGHSMNEGLAIATGDYIGIVESDDFASPEMFEKLYALAVKHDADVVKSNFFEHRDSSVNERFYENLKGCPYNRVFSPMEERDVFFVLPTIWSGIYNRRFITEHRIRFLETPGASYQDTSFAFKIWAFAHRAYLIEDALLHYRRDNVGSSVNSVSKIFCICDEFEEIEKFLEDNPSKQAILASAAFAMKFRAYRWNYKRLAPAFQYAFLLKMEEQFKKAEKRTEFDTSYLTAAELKEFNELIRHPEIYFKDTSKGYYDDRLLQLRSTLNLQIYKRGFLVTLTNSKGVIIFGAGGVGKKIAEILIEKEGVQNIVCFAVSNLAGNPETVMGLPVYPIHHLNAYMDDYVVVVATKEYDQYEIIHKLKSMRFKNIISLESNLLNTLLKADKDT